MNKILFLIVLLATKVEAQKQVEILSFAKCMCIEPHFSLKLQVADSIIYVHGNYKLPVENKQYRRGVYNKNKGIWVGDTLYVKHFKYKIWRFTPRQDEINLLNHYQKHSPYKE